MSRSLGKRFIRVGAIAIIGLLVWAGLFLRFFHLEDKPMHADEAVNGVMVHRMLEGEPVSFDPTHYHGPSLRYLAFLSTRLHKVVADEGLGEVSLRWLTALAGVLGVFTVSLFRSWIGLRASLVALALMAVSPGFIYFSRYFIHEMLFLLITLVFLVALWRFLEQRNLKWALWTGGLFGLLHATRETALLVLGAVVLALIAALGKGFKREAQWLISTSSLKTMAAAILCAVGVSVLFYSAFFTHPQGPIDSVLTYFRYEIEPGHEKPFLFYLEMILGRWTALGYLGEGSALLLGLVGFWVAFKPEIRGETGYSFHTFLAVYVLVTTAVYSVIGYKTPWLALNFLAGWILLAGVGWAFAYEKLPAAWMRLGWTALLVLVLGQSLYQSHLLAFRYSTHSRNPYAYSHTSPDLLQLVDRIETLARFHPDGLGMRIDIMANEYWPLPWYLRDYTAVGYWETQPPQSDAPIRVYSLDDTEGIEQIDEALFVTEMRGLRDGVLLLVAVEKNLWERQFSTD